MDNRPTWLFRISLIWLLLVGVSCQRADNSVRSVSAHDALLTILVEYRRYSETDLYRFDIPQNLSGMNIFRVTLQRLEYYEQNHPGINTDIVRFTRAESYARLRAFSLAIEEFGRVGSDEPSELSQKALQRAEYFSAIDAALTMENSTNSMEDYLQILDLQMARLEKLRSADDNDPEAYFILREIEKMMVEKALVLFRNRFVMRDGALRALDLMDEIIEQHATSRLIYRHHLMLGRYQYELAQDLAVANPADGLQFDMELFENLLREARGELVLVAQADGYYEKFEAAALLDALEAFERKIRILAQ